MSDAQWAADELSRGEAARREGRLDDARANFAAAADWYTAQGQFEPRAHALTRKAQVERDLGNYDTAIAYQEEALSLERMLNRKGIAQALRRLADTLEDAGRPGDAARYYAEMEKLYRSNSDTPPLEMANAVRSLAIRAQNAGNKNEARLLWVEARERYAKLGALFHQMTGERRNPGVEEAEKRLASIRR